MHVLDRKGRKNLSSNLLRLFGIRVTHAVEEPDNYELSCQYHT